MEQTLIQRIVSAHIAKANCIKSGVNFDWNPEIERLTSLLPYGSGFDMGTKIEYVTKDKVILSFSFHHMNSDGYYDGWTEHKVIVKPSFDGIDIRITGKDYNFAKDYFYDVFHTCLGQIVKR